MQNLDSVAAIVTGGGSGIGAAVARSLAGAGCKVSLWDTNEEAAGKVADEIGGLAVVCDVTSAESVESALARSCEAHGPARILVNCAGILIPKRIVGRNAVFEIEIVFTNAACAHLFNSTLNTTGKTHNFARLYTQAFKITALIHSIGRPCDRHGQCRQQSHPQQNKPQRITAFILIRIFHVAHFKPPDAPVQYPES